MNVSIAFLWQQRYELDVDQVGFLFSLVGILSAICQGALVGVFNRLWGERRMMIYGCVMVGIGLAAIPFVPIGARALGPHRCRRTADPPGPGCGLRPLQPDPDRAVVRRQRLPQSKLDLHPQPPGFDRRSRAR